MRGEGAGLAVDLVTQVTTRAACGGRWRAELQTRGTSFEPRGLGAESRGRGQRRFCTGHCKCKLGPEERAALVVIAAAVAVVLQHGTL